MKIAYFLDVLRGIGGAGNLLLQQAMLMSEIYDVIVVIPADKKGNTNDEYVRRCNMYQLPHIEMVFCTANRFSAIDFMEAMDNVNCVEEFAKQEKITFFHSVQLNITVEYVSRKLKIPHLMNIYQIQSNEFFICPGDIYPHYHLCDSLLYSQIWRDQLNIKSECVRPIALGKNLKKKNSYSKEKIIILMLGVVCLRKNQLGAIRAIEQCIGKQNLELHIVGDCTSEYAEICKLYVEEHGLRQVVYFHGFNSNIVTFLENSDCLLCSSTDESFPSSIAESLTYDLTIISTPVAGVPEVFFNKKNSFISRDFSDSSIKESILECLEYYQNGKIEAIHKNAEDTWMSNFEYSIIKDQINLFYHDILNRYICMDLQPFYKIKKDVVETKKLLSTIINDQYQWMNQKLLYYTYIRKHIKFGKLYIWGSGIFGKLAFEIYKILCPSLEIIAFIDSYKSGFCCGIPVIKIEDIYIEKNNYYNVSFAKDRDKAIQYLENKGLQLFRQIWCIP